MSLRHGLAMAAPVLVIDQALKHWALGLGDRVLPILGEPGAGLSAGLVLNPGIVFGMVLPANGWPRMLVLVLALSIAGVVVVRLLLSRRPWMNLARGAVIGGAASNIADRVRHDAVVDYLILHRSGTAIAFNLADIAFVVGAVLLMLGAAVLTLTARGGA